MDDLLIIANERRVDTEPELLVWEVRIERGGGVWFESFGSEHDLDKFLAGLRIGLAINSPGSIIDLPVRRNYFKDRG